MNCYLKTVAAVVVALLVLIVLLLPAVMASSGFDRGSSARVKKVDELFNQNCARCHGADGRSDTPSGRLFKAPDFTDAEWWKKNSRITGPGTLRLIVARGKAGMPGFGKKLTRPQISLLVERVRSFRKLGRKS